MAKYFLVTTKSLPVEVKRNNKILQYFNFGILLFLFVTLIKNSEQIIDNKNININRGKEIEKIEQKVRKIENNTVNYIKKKTKTLKDSSEYINSRVNKIAETFENEIKQEINDFSKPHSNEVTISLPKEVKMVKNIVINITTPIDEEKLSNLLLCLFDELQAVGEDEAFIDVERNSLGIPIAIHVKSIKNLNEERFQTLIFKLSKDINLSLHFSNITRTGN